jgi:hypothetical protein
VGWDRTGIRWARLLCKSYLFSFFLDERWMEGWRGGRTALSVSFHILDIGQGVLGALLYLCAVTLRSFLFWGEVEHMNGIGFTFMAC